MCDIRENIKKNNDKPHVSVIIAVYNVEPYLRRSLDCLVNQTMSNLEFICVDDCSTDNSLSILREYAEKDKRFKIITSEVNKGAAIARNKGLDAATGEYLGFIDSDDAIDLNYYEKLYTKAVETSADIVKRERKEVYSNGKMLISNLNNKIKKDKYAFTYEWTTAIYKSSVIFDNNIRFPEECTKAQDIVFLNRIMLKARNLELIDDVCYYYYKRDDSLNSQKIPLKSIKSACRARILMALDLNKSGLYEKNINQYIENYMRIVASVFYTNFQNDTKEAKTCCAENFIDLYNLILDKKLFEKKYQYLKFIKCAKANKLKTLSEIFFKLKNQDDIFEKYSKFYNNVFSNIFSIRNSYNRKYKNLKILGIKIKIKNTRHCSVLSDSCSNNHLIKLNKKRKILLQCQGIIYYYLGLASIYTKYPNRDVEVDVIFSSSKRSLDFTKVVEDMKLSKYTNNIYSLRFVMSKLFSKLEKKKKNFFNTYLYNVKYEKTIKKQIKSQVNLQDNYDEIFYSHEQGNLLITSLKFIYPSANFVMYGDGVGLLFGKNTKLINKNNIPYKFEFYNEIKPNEVIGLFPHTEDESLNLDDVPVKATDKSILSDLIIKDKLLQEKINEFSYQVINEYKDKKIIVLLAPLLHHSIYSMTEDDIRNVYSDILDNYCTEDSALVVKLHPADEFNDFELLNDICEKKNLKIIKIPDNLKDYPIEMFYSLLKHSDNIITFSSSSNLTIRYLYDFNCNEALDIVKKYPMYDYVKTILNVYNTIYEKTKNWDKNSLLYKIVI